MIHEFLTDLEVAELQKFNDNLALSDAVKKVILAVINNRGVVKKGQSVKPTFNGALGLSAQALSGRNITNEELGADIRAYTQAVYLLEDGFKEIAKIKIKKEEGNPEKNPAI
jgi:hypothetical protein